MLTTHVIVIADADPGAASVYSNESFQLELCGDDRGDNRIPWSDRPAYGPHPLGREHSKKALGWYLDAGRDRTIAGVTFVKTVIR